MVKRHASAVWEGGLKDGSGKVSTERGVLKDTPYNFSGRFEEGTKGTNPEELIGAAHAGCFSMALSGQLAQRDIAPQRIETEAAVTIEKTDAGMTVTAIHLVTRVTAAGADPEVFQEGAEAAKKGCPISRLLGPGTKITLDAKLA